MKGVEYLTSNINNESVVLTEVDGSVGNGDATNPDAQQKAIETDGSIIPTAIPILVTLYSISSSKSIGEYSIAEKTITIGCTKVNKPVGDKKDTKKVYLLKKSLIQTFHILKIFSNKFVKSGEFSFDNIKEINLKVFEYSRTIDLGQGTNGFSNARGKGVRPSRQI